MKLRIKFEKGNPIKFISHLDLMRAIERAFRRADLPLAYSQGFNPRPKISFTQALSVGYTSSCEYMDVEFEKDVPSDYVIDRLNGTLPEGLRILEAGLPKEGLPLSKLNRAMYELKASGVDVKKLQVVIDEILNSDEIVVEKVKKSSKCRVNIAPFIHDIFLIDLENVDIILGMILSIGQKGSVSPKTIIEQIEKRMGKKIEIKGIHRKKMYFSGEGGNIVPL